MAPVGSQLSGALRVTVVARSTTVPPSLAMPPAAEAVLRVTRLPFMTRRPWLARPPPVAAEFPDTLLPMTVALACGALPSPPPNPEAEFPDSTVFLTVRTPVPGTLPEGRLPMPPPMPGLPWASLGAVLPVIRLPAIVIAPWFKMPAPIPPGAALSMIKLDLITARPPLAMPAPAGAPPPSVAELCATVLALRVRLEPCGSPPLPGPLAIPPPLPAVFKSHLAGVENRGPGVIQDATGSAAGGVAGHLARVQHQRPGRPVLQRAAGDAAARAHLVALRRVPGHYGGIQHQPPGEVEHRAARPGSVPAGDRQILQSQVPARPVHLQDAERLAAAAGDRRAVALDRDRRNDHRQPVRPQRAAVVGLGQPVRAPGRQPDGPATTRVSRVDRRDQPRGAAARPRTRHTGARSGQCDARRQSGEGHQCPRPGRRSQYPPSGIHQDPDPLGADPASRRST